MRFVSLDIETTGTDPVRSQILSIGMVVEDTNNILPMEELPKLHLYLTYDYIYGSPFVLSMNRDIIKAIGDFNETDKDDVIKQYKDKGIQFVYPSNVPNTIVNFLLSNGYNGYDSDKNRVVFTAAGKNLAGFDIPFLELLPNWKRSLRIRSRVIDPTTSLINWKEDDAPPGLAACMERTGVEGSVTHDALQDAIDTLKVIRSMTNNYTV